MIVIHVIGRENARLLAAFLAVEMARMSTDVMVRIAPVYILISAPESAGSRRN